MYTKAYGILSLSSKLTSPTKLRWTICSTPGICKRINFTQIAIWLELGIYWTSWTVINDFSNLLPSWFFSSTILHEAAVLQSGILTVLNLPTLMARLVSQTIFSSSSKNLIQGVLYESDNSLIDPQHLYETNFHVRITGNQFSSQFLDYISKRN